MTTTTETMTNIYENWEFVYNTHDLWNKKEYPHGYYLNKTTNEMYSFKEGISHIIGEEAEDKIYNLWWVENG